MDQALEIRNKINQLKDREKRIKKEIRYIERRVVASIVGKRRDKKELIKEKLSELMKTRQLISDYESELFSRKTKKLKIEKSIIKKSVKKYLASPKSIAIAKKTSFYYMMKKNYLFNPYKTPDEIFSSYKNQMRTFLFGKFLNKYGSIRNINEKNPLLNKIKKFTDSVDITKSRSVNIFDNIFGSALTKAIDKWFPGKFGSTPRLIKAWLKRKMLYGESGMSKKGVKKLSYGGYQRVRKLGVTFSSPSYLSKRRSIRSIRRGFRKGGGYRRFA